MKVGVLGALGKVGREVCKAVEEAVVKAKGEAYSRIEHPKGEYGCHVIGDGKQNPVRVHVRAPSFANLQVLPIMARGQKIADLIATLGSIDIVLGDVDR